MPKSAALPNLNSFLRIYIQTLESMKFREKPPRFSLLPKFWKSIRNFLTGDEKAVLDAARVPAAPKIISQFA